MQKDKQIQFSWYNKKYSLASFIDSSSPIYIIPVHTASLATIPGTGPQQAVPIYELMDKNKDFLWQREMS